MMMLADLRAAAVRLSADPAVSTLTVRQLALLIELAWHDPTPLSTGDLAARIGVGLPVVTRACHASALAPFMSDRPHPYDGRLRAITLTEEGRALVDSLFTGSAERAA